MLDVLAEAFGYIYDVAASCHLERFAKRNSRQRIVERSPNVGQIRWCIAEGDLSTTSLRDVALRAPLKMTATSL